MARATDFDLAKALAAPSFTPGQRDAPALVELVVGGEEPAAQRAAAALAKLGETGRKAVDARLAGRGPVGGDTSELGDAPTARLVGVIGLLARGGDEPSLAALVERTRDDHVRVRRAAISALGKVRGDIARDALLARWDAEDVTPDERRALVEALGKIGGEAARTRLSALTEGADDAELQRRRDRALLMITRTDARTEESAIDTDAALPHTLDVVLRCKRGLTELLVADLARFGFKAIAEGDEAVVVSLRKPWSSLYQSHLWMTAAFRVTFDARAIADAIGFALGNRTVRENLTAMTRGAIRYRLAFAQGKRRALIWQLAKKLPYLNDPTDSTWEFFIEDEDRVIEMTPKKAHDPRFAWRVAEVPAASHPTVAAALAVVGEARDGDRVWDPFVGSGAELVERARLGTCTLIGTDIDDAALAAARANLDAAKLTATLEKADARTYAPGPVDLILTNPPLGSRVQVDAAALLCEALPHFSRVLAPRGRLVWITPATKRTSPAAEGAGLLCTRRLAVDLGGVRGHLERWERPG